MVQHTTGKIPEQVQLTRVYGTTNHGLYNTNDRPFSKNTFFNIG